VSPIAQDNRDETLLTVVAGLRRLDHRLITAALQQGQGIDAQDERDDDEHKQPADAESAAPKEETNWNAASANAGPFTAPVFDVLAFAPALPPHAAVSAPLALHAPQRGAGPSPGRFAPSRAS
jgi:hypothetical protein